MSDTVINLVIFFFYFFIFYFFFDVQCGEEIEMIAQI